MNTTLASLLSPGGGNRIAFAFSCMEIAEQTITERKRSGIGKLAFLPLCPSDLILATRSLDVYRSHCAEICDRMVSGAPLERPTRAEILCAMSRATLVAPPSSDFSGAMESLFAQVFGRTVDGRPSQFRESHRGAWADVIAQVERRMGPQERGAA